MNSALLIVACLMLAVIVTYLQREDKRRKLSDEMYRRSNQRILDNDKQRTEAYKATLARLEVVEQQKRDELTQLRKLEQAKLKELEKINFWRTR